MGSNFHTAVPGLETDAGCRGDLVTERLVYAYGAAGASPVGATSDATIDALDGIAGDCRPLRQTGDSSPRDGRRAAARPLD